MVFPADQRQPGARESAGLATSDETRFADGRKVGEVTWRFGARATVTRDMPGWYIADGTQPIDLEIAGVNYGKPNLTGRFVVGANDDAGGAGTFPLGTSAGGGPLTMPTGTVHYEDAEIAVNPEETKHDITQPVFAGPAAHAITQPVLNNHLATLGAVELAAAGGSGIWVIANNSAANAALSTQHGLATNVALSNNAPHAAPARTTDVALSHNDPSHDGADVAVDDVDVDWSDSTPDVPLPPYVAVWPLIKLR